MPGELFRIHVDLRSTTAPYTEMEKRVVVPEILDHLPADDPEAMRSRRDLRRINGLMGNEKWICETALGFKDSAARGIVEIGAGDGQLTARLARLFPSSAVKAYDLAPRPPRLIERVIWTQGDLFTVPPPQTGGVLVANLFLHHFEGQSLRDLGKWCEGFEVLIFNEPDRASFPHFLGGLLHPFINRITRHDMHVSIRAGFSQGELLDLLGLNTENRVFRETSTWRGSRRAVAWRI